MQRQAGRANAPSSLPLQWTSFRTPLGWCALAWTARGLRRLQLPEASRAATEHCLVAGLPPTTRAARPPAWVRTLQARLVRHLRGTPQDLRDVPLDPGPAGPFAQAVWSAARRVRAGRTVSYGELARAVGRPGAARAVGGALGRNPVPLVVPCHRVLAADGGLHGFSALGGVATKRRLLALEGVGTLESGKKFGC